MDHLFNYVRYIIKLTPMCHMPLPVHSGCDLTNDAVNKHIDLLTCELSVIYVLTRIVM